MLGRPKANGHGISEPFIRRRVATTLLTVGLALAGRSRSSCCR